MSIGRKQWHLDCAMIKHDAYIRPAEPPIFGDTPFKHKPQVLLTAMLLRGEHC